MHRIVLLIALSWIGMAFAAKPAPEAPIHLTPGATTTPQPADDSGSPHDKHGKTSDSARKFVADAAAGCEWQKVGSDWKPSRVISYGHELDPAAVAAH